MRAFAQRRPRSARPTLSRGGVPTQLHRRRAVEELRPTPPYSLALAAVDVGEQEVVGLDLSRGGVGMLRWRGWTVGD